MLWPQKFLVNTILRHLKTFQESTLLKSSTVFKAYFIPVLFTHFFQRVFEHFSGNPVTGVYSPSVQKTIYDISKEVLKAHPELEKISFRLPNIHYYLVNFSDFKTDQKNNNEVFYTFDGAHGQIEATIQRPQKAKL